ncbi:hypothetical protein L7F22_039535 [Adiantum nelumboides]|nr:hypothetical protein [Adiantum nelumboides]
MSVAYQSWEMSSGPSVGFKMAIQSKSDMYAMPDTLSPDSSSYNGGTLGTLSSSESFLKAVVGSSTDLSNDLILPSPKVLMPQDSVTRGFSTLSLHSSQDFEGSVSASKNVDRKWVPTTETSISKSAFHSAEYQIQESTPDFCSLAYAGLEKNCKPWFTSVSKPSCTAMTLADGFYLHNSRTKLAVVVEEKPLEDDSSAKVCNDASDDDLEVDSNSSSSTSSLSSLHEMLVDGHSSSGDGSSTNGDVEVQSEYRGACSSSLGTSPPKKGLSRFYSGKSRSFSCLADVVSVKDLSKPENPYAKKRKCIVGRGLHNRPQLPPLQKGVASISKKLPNNGKSTLALAVAMSAKNDGMDTTVEKGFQNCTGFGSALDIPLGSRSYSFSDLQGAASRCSYPP